MPRRRYRLFVLCAIVIVFLLYRTLETSWSQSNDSYGSTRSSSKSPIQPPADGSHGPADLSGHASAPLLADEQDEAEKNLQGGTMGVDMPKYDTPESSNDEDETTTPSKPATGDDTVTKEKSSQNQVPDIPKAPEIPKAPDSPDVPSVHWSDPPVENHALDRPAEKAEEPAEHWVRPKENWPIPPGSLIPIPTGTPKQIPKVQFAFGTESEIAKSTRLQRKARVKTELERAWSGYRKNAWMHDELSPLSNGFRDPFCGWAATLVDSLDTLWIAGMTDEFDEAANAVAKIDFTFTPKNDIPVFETTIRYLGGLIAAYDVSGGAASKYPILLQKATELAEVLMGIFDTPNRMPLLYYVWREPYASEPHRANTLGIAELATLSLEFTRLAQLTGTAKYYDAIDRITNALVKMQAEGHTHIPGLFPERIDASGCNKTATTIRDTLSFEAQNQMDSATDLDAAPEGFKPKSDTIESDATELDTMKSGTTELGTTKSDTTELGTTKSDTTELGTTKSDTTLSRRAAIPFPDSDTEKTETSRSSEPLGYLGAPAAEESTAPKSNGRSGPLAADGSKSKWDCVPQGLVPAAHGGLQYHMGGAQDSAYEYFPKQYLLLGGLEPKYQKLHEDTVDAINDRLLYRPMIDDKGWDILFPAKISLEGRARNKVVTTYELAHLTCFIGGMYGLGGKIFARPKDVETAKQLTDACVWAYQSTATGIMPEFAHLAPCPTLEKCEFNQTQWYEMLDTSMEWRKKEMIKWEKNQALLAEEQARNEAAAKHKAAATKTAASHSFDDDDESDLPADSIYRQDDLSTSLESELKPKDGLSTSSESVRKPKGDSSTSLDSEVQPKGYSSTSSEAVLKPEDDSSTSLESEVKRKVAKRAGIPMPELDTAMSAPKGEAGSELPESLKKKLNMENSRWADKETTEPTETTLQTDVDTDFETDIETNLGVDDDDVFDTPPTRVTSYHKPMTHEEFVESKLKRENLPRGYTDIVSQAYILRPEAIESVWYMYRITGDPEWMDKGWKMFEATIAATRTEFAHSAIYDVMVPEGGLKDEMESFWIAETLKYYYLLFSEPDVISLDEWVLNTEAHPFKRPS
ncbi:glycosyl hydrolase family 47-domain-containing protein [Dactylonectria macrodidyma]|uniref:alpha-1,2-Mannosidase n=1 Tax=Dactylonectria macrodidyma TaxID=307937 RepID=A0A9P9FBT2_9HYPO|nr:glycosyl hydrolase family 47-domain-containing protein [Dactylonectria macrodidyma]